MAQQPRPSQGLLAQRPWRQAPRSIFFRAPGPRQAGPATFPPQKAGRDLLCHLPMKGSFRFGRGSEVASFPAQVRQRDCHGNKIRNRTKGYVMGIDIHLHAFEFLPFPLTTQKGCRAVFHETCLAFAEAGNIGWNKVLAANAFARSTRFLGDIRSRARRAFRRMCG